MIKCQACGTQNLDTSQFCDECGDALIKYEAPNIEDLEKGAAKTRVDSPAVDNPVFRAASVTSLNVDDDEDEKETSEGINAVALDEVSRADIGRFKAHGVHANLVIERGQAIGTEFPISSEESNIGRWDADNGVFPDIDLDAHDAEAKVSRKHARILLQNGQYMIEDLGSTNGTFVNRGRRLIPGNPHVLNDGDEIIVGKTFLRFQIVK
ncbi:MAG: FHA domain-containing protein [Acidobacteriota bacterium]|nr:FHA domain-containing protein [Acidobacteriota bacterium]MDH3529243.1 FHA domain-containing protein [Acidobacteriota bacterium]